MSIQKVHLLPLLAITTLFVACSSKEEASKTPEPESGPIPFVDSLPDEPGVYNLVLDLGEEKATYTISIPEGYTGEKAVGFVMVLHDGGGRNNYSPHYGAMMLQYFATSTLKELNAIMVAPSSGDSGWNSIRNQQFVAKLIDQITEKYSINEDYTMVTGYSMGGSGTWFFAEHREDFFRVAVPIAGRPQSDKTDWKSSIYIIHSDDDQVVPSGPSRKYFEKLEKAGVRVKANFLKGLSHHQTRKYADPLADTVPWILQSWGHYADASKSD